MEAIDTRAKKGVRVYLERRGFEILEEGWAHGGDVADFIARDEDDLVFVHCQITQNGGEGFPEEDANRVVLERLAAAYLAEHLDSEDIRIRFDVVSMLIVGESRALLRHHLNALGTL
jgi:putative endonuclease